MVPPPGSALAQAEAAPRARGDGPVGAAAGGIGAVCSPRPRGWSSLPTPEDRAKALLPAPAGMVPSAVTPSTRTTAAPRARGDGPPPHTATPTTKDCSPRPRGWSRRGPGRSDLHGLLPAPAGMVPPRSRWSWTALAAPRARGDGPPVLGSCPCSKNCSPRPRGWSLLDIPVVGSVMLLPAPAGMVPGGWPSAWRTAPAPRARGDGPATSRRSLRSPACSPRPRGWSRHQPGPLPPGPLLPAPAGMVPGRHAGGGRGGPAPRARGDGPQSAAGLAAVNRCSPRPRGWSPGPGPAAGRRRLLPAPAGMVPS